MESGRDRYGIADPGVERQQTGRHAVRSIEQEDTMYVGVDSFVSAVTDPATGKIVGPEERIEHLLEEIALADTSGLYSFGIGEHHREEYYDSAPPVILGAAAARTSRIRLGSAVTVLSAADPVRVFQQFATLDLIAKGRIDLVVGRGSFTEAFPLFGLDLRDYDSLFAEKLELLLKIRDETHVTWSGRHRPALTGQGVYPRPAQHPLPIWVGVGGTPESFVRAGLLGLPLMVAIIGGEPRQFAPLVDLYRRAGAQAGHAPETLQVGLHVFGFVGDSVRKASDTIYPGWHEMFTKVSRERGFRAPTREQFDATSGPDGAFFMGDPDTVARKLRRVSEQLGGVDRVSIQMTNPRLAHADLLRGIELLGTEVAPQVADA
jgi:probable LLM family oxidoreductase